jgi:hypothetical protein
MEIAFLSGAAGVIFLSFFNQDIGGILVVIALVAGSAASFFSPGNTRVTGFIIERLRKQRKSRK